MSGLAGARVYRQTTG